MEFYDPQDPLSLQFASIDISTSVFSKCVSTDVSIERVSTGCISTKRVSTNVSTQSVYSDVSTYVPAKFAISTNVSLKCVFTDISNECVSIEYVSTDISIENFSIDISTGLFIESIFTDVSIHVSTKFASTNLPTGISMKDNVLGHTSGSTNIPLEFLQTTMF